MGAYWFGVITLAVGGWTTRLVRARRIKMSTNAEKTGVESVRQEKRMHVSLDLRRKFFHALAAIMFVPGIAFDVSTLIFCS